MNSSNTGAATIASATSHNGIAGSIARLSGRKAGNKSRNGATLM